MNFRLRLLQFAVVELFLDIFQRLLFATNYMYVVIYEVSIIFHWVSLR